MATMRELSRWIRDYGHDPRHQHRLIANTRVWYQLWTAMDIIDDVDSAMDAYLDNEFPAEIGERYLRLYGAMQGLFLQQDALADLIKVIHPAKEVLRNDVLKDVRDARNASVGHPTQLRRNGELSTHGIVQNSMTKNGFSLLSYPAPERNLLQYVPVLEMIRNQRAEAVRILEEVINELREQDKAHKAKFRNSKLVSVFDQAGYAFEKIFEESRPNAVRVLGRWAIDHLQTCLDNFARLLKERGAGIEAYDSIEYRYNEIAHPLAELRKFLFRESSEVLSDKSAVVFAEALQSHFDTLRHIAGEIDDEYASAPSPIGRPELSNVPNVVTTGEK